jgi:hypothetical protein
MGRIFANLLILFGADFPQFDIPSPSRLDHSSVYLHPGTSKCSTAQHPIMRKIMLLIEIDIRLFQDLVDLGN